MTEKKYLFILFLACLSLTILCGIAFFASRSSAPQEIDTVLLNSKYSSKLTKIQVKGVVDAISLWRTSLGGKFFWCGSEGQGGDEPQMVFPLDMIFFEEFLSTMEEVRSLTTVSKKTDKNTLSGFDLGKNQGFTMDFYLEDGSTASSLHFGQGNYSGYKIYLRTPDSPIYQGKDDFYPWLTTSAKSWADMALVSQQILGIQGEKEVQRLVLNLPSISETGKITQKVLTRGQDFSAKVSKLLSLRGGSLVHPSVVEGQDLVGEITVDTGFGSSLTLYIYEGNLSQSDEDISSFYVIPQFNLYFSPNSSGSSENPFNYGFEISGWTWNSLLELNS